MKWFIKEVEEKQQGKGNCDYDDSFEKNKGRI